MAEIKFPTFKYSDFAKKGQGYGQGSGTFTDPDALTAPVNPVGPEGYSLDQALAYSIMQNVDPEKRSAARKEELKDLLAFQEQQMKEGSKYKMLFDLPERLIQAATLPEQLAAEGSRGIAASMMQAGQQIPQLVGYTPRNSYSYTPTRYFQ